MGKKACLYLPRRRSRTCVDSSSWSKTEQKQPVTPGNLTHGYACPDITVSIALALAEAKNYTYWAYLCAKPPIGNAC